MMRTRIKICGLRREEDALYAAQQGADAIGLIFYPGSARVVDLASAKRIVSALPAFVESVALFVNAPPEQVHAVCTEIRPSLLQFHGDESPAYCEAFDRPFVKALRVGGAMTAADLLQFRDDFASAKALLLDTLAEGHYGGSGQSFDWSLIPDVMRASIVLSGGLNPSNVRDAVKAIRPWAVDVSSGVESEKGIKDHDKIRQFIQQVRIADHHADV
jgi:phosphoribosylanthranilate isomerase